MTAGILQRFQQTCGAVLHPELRGNNEIERFPALGKSGHVLGRRQFLVTGAAMLAGSTLARAHNGTVHVVIENLAFLPAEIEVRVGETIEWTNKDRFAHTATVQGGWDIPIPPGKTATHIVTADDTVDYYCRFHPNMTGRIKVSA